MKRRRNNFLSDMNWLERGGSHLRRGKHEKKTIDKKKDLSNTRRSEKCLPENRSQREEGCIETCKEVSQEEIKNTKGASIANRNII